MALNESDTRAKLIDPAIHARGWTEDLIRREETAAAIEIIDGKPRKRAKGRVDYTLRVKVNPQTQPVAVALIETKAEDLPPSHGLEQAKLYASCKRLNVLRSQALGALQNVFGGDAAEVCKDPDGKPRRLKGSALGG
jgi:type I restriction enzyme R subunit